MTRIAVLIPCYNEAIAIPGVIAGFRAALPDAAIHVYDNNSSDGTAAIARQAGARVGQERRQGKGHVVRRMFADIDADIYVLVDGDGTYDAASAPALIEKLRAETLDMVTATRVEQAQAAYRRGHRLGNAVLTGLVALLFSSRLGDMLSGYRVFSRRFVKSFPALAGGFETETELTVHALQLAMPTGEVACPYRERPAGSTSKLHSFRDGARILRLIVMLVKDERPIPFFTAAAAAMLALGLIMGIPVVLEFLRIGLVPRLPTAIVSACLVMLSFLSTACGLILDSVARGRREMKRLLYLAIPGPARAAMNAGQTAAIRCIDGAWALWLIVWVALSGRVKRVARRENRWLQAAHILPMGLAAFLLLFRTQDGSTWLETILAPRRDWMVYAACLLVVAGLALAVRARLILAGNWSGTVTLKHGHELIRTGPYAWVRHPIYTGLLAAMLGNALAIDEVRGVLALALITAAFLKKLRTEEAFMIQAFGDDYRAYRRETAALIPGLY